MSPDAVIDHADAAMFCAKAQDHNGIYVTHIGAEPALTQTSRTISKRADDSMETRDDARFTEV